MRRVRGTRCSTRTADPQPPATTLADTRTERTNRTLVTATHCEDTPIMPDTSGLRAFVPATINATARVQPAEWGENPSFDAIVALDVLTGYRRAGLGRQDMSLATALGESSCG